MIVRVRKKKLNTKMRRRLRTRRKLFGTPDKPRLVVRRSLNNIYAEIVIDSENKVVTGASSLSPELKSKIKEAKGKVEMAKFVGELVARRALSKGIKKVIFDKREYKYHGRVKALAEGARKGGLKF